MIHMTTIIPTGIRMFTGTIITILTITITTTRIRIRTRTNTNTQS